jgi:hypothetical protein
MSDLVRRKRVELDAKLRGMLTDIEHWRELGTRGGPLEKHHSQLTRIGVVIRDAVTEIDNERKSLVGDDDQFLARAAPLELQLLCLHRVWDFFRVRLAQRLVPHTALFLAVANELARRLVDPIVTRRTNADGFDAALHAEAPFVYLCAPIRGALSNTPFALGRDLGIDGSLDESGVLGAVPVPLRRLVDCVPIPIIGVPWYQLAHPPDMALIAHEAGHVAEFDAQITGDLDAALESALAGRADPARDLSAWRAWRVEAFADCFAGAALGPGYACALDAFLAAPRASLANDIPNPRSPYPPAAVRIMLAFAAAEAGGWGPDAQVAKLRQDWLDGHADIPIPTTTVALFEDVAGVARALIDSPLPRLGGASIRDCFAPQSRTAQHVAACNLQLLYNLELDAVDPGAAIAAAALVEASRPGTFSEPRTVDRLLAAMRASIAPGVRSEVHATGASAQSLQQASRRLLAEVRMIVRESDASLQG